jgi:hypothetical protein
MRTVTKPQNTVDARAKNLLIEPEMADLLAFPGLRFGRLRGAVFHNTRSLRCAQIVVAKILYTALNIAQSVDAALPRGDCACRLFPHRLPVCLFAFWNCDHLRRPRGALGRSDPMLPLGKPDAPLRVRRSSHGQLIARRLTRPQHKLVSRHNEFQCA